MPPPTTFARFLIGLGHQARPPAFYGYIGMWLHLLVGAPLLAVAGRLDGLQGLAWLVLASYCLGLAIYGLRSRTLGPLAGVAGYAAGLGPLVLPQVSGSAALLLALLAAIPASYQTLAGEYDRFAQDILGRPAASVPVWPVLLAAVATVAVAGIGYLLI
jgi:hypothetical protein